MIISLPISGQDGSTRVLFCIWKLRIAISCCFLKCFPAIANSVVLIFHFVFSVGARKLSTTGSIRNFENKNFTPKSRIFVSLKVKLHDMTDWHKERVDPSSMEMMNLGNGLYPPRSLSSRRYPPPLSSISQTGTFSVIFIPQFY